MNTIGQEAAVYTDFSQLEALKAEAQANPGWGAGRGRTAV